MGNAGLALVEEVTVRLQRGGRRAQFERDLKALLKGQKPEAKGAPNFDALDLWVELYERIGMPLLTLPTDAQKAALTEFGFRLIFMPAVGEDQYPASFVKPEWGKYLNVKQIVRMPLPGRLVAMETIARPNWNDPNGYGEDRLAKKIGLDRRFGVSWNALHGEDNILVKVAQKLDFPVPQVRCPSAEEYNFAGNMFNMLRTQHDEDMPDLGSTNSWEWCENAYESDYRLLAGYRGIGGRAAVGGHWAGGGHYVIGFRVLVVL